MPSALAMSSPSLFPSHPCTIRSHSPLGERRFRTRVLRPRQSGRGAVIARPGHRAQAGPRRRSAGHRGATRGRASAERSRAPSPPNHSPRRAGAAAPGQLRPERGGAASTPPCAPFGGRAGAGRGGGRWEPSGRRSHPLPLRLQHVARRCARRHRPRAARGPPPPVRRHRGGAGPQPAARNLLQPGEAARAPGALFSPGDGARGGKAQASLGLGLPRRPRLGFAGPSPPPRSPAVTWPGTGVGPAAPLPALGARVLRPSA